MKIKSKILDYLGINQLNSTADKNNALLNEILKQNEKNKSELTDYLVLLNSQNSKFLAEYNSNNESKIKDLKELIEEFKSKSDNEYSTLLNKIEKIDSELKANSEKTNKIFSYLTPNSIDFLNTDPIDSFSLLDINLENEPLKFNLTNDIDIENDWKLISKNNSNQASSFASQLAGSGLNIGAVSSQGLFKATVSPESLMKYADGSISSMTHNGTSIGSHSGFVGASSSAFTPLIAFQFASILTGQYFYNGISKQLNSIKKTTEQLVRFYHIERESKLDNALTILNEFTERSYFSIEDNIRILKVIDDVSTIRSEYFILTNRSVVNFNITTYDNSEEKIILSPEDISWFESSIQSTLKAVGSVKEKFSAIVNKASEKFNSGNSGKKANKLNEELNESSYFYYANMTLMADQIVKASKIIEVKLYLSDKSPGQNNLGKMKELANLLPQNLTQQKYVNEINKINYKVKTLVIDNFKDHFNSSKINKESIFKQQQNWIKELGKIDKKVNDSVKSSNDSLLGFQQKQELLIEFKENQEYIYIKK
tara:strand:+ start:524 stop:2143 length:1620 start_codon:yes stop_codon:yes gene_type:complete